MSRRALCLLHIYDLYQGGKDHMKKNVKYLGMAAAALLAVAPVVTTGVVNADQLAVTPGDNNQNTNGGTITTSLSIDNANSLVSNTAASSLKGTLTATLKAADGSTSNVNVQLVNGGKLQVFEDNNGTVGTTAVSTLEAGHTYVAKATGVSFTGLKPNTDYTYGTTTVRSDGYGNLFADGTKTVESDPFTLGNSAIQGTPYFVVDGAVSTTATIENAPTSVDALNTAIMNKVQPNGGSADNKALTVSAVSAIKTALQNAGVKVADNGTFSAPAGNVVIPLTVRFTNGKTATINITAQYNGANTNALAPVISTSASNYSESNGSYTLKTPVAVGATFNANTIAKDFSATLNKDDSTKVAVSVLSSDVNTSVPGTYSVVLTATNPAGYTSTRRVYVTVGAEGAKYETVKYSGKGAVNIWNVNGNKVSFSGTRVNNGQQLATFNSITVDGVSYTRVGSKDSNTWIQTQYLDGTYKPSTDNNGEESVSGVLTVKYDGKGKVGLTNAEGKYTGQYVSKNSRWKVFAKKTINGREFYRIGNQNQWIPAQYSELAD